MISVIALARMCKIFTSYTGYRCYKSNFITFLRPVTLTCDLIRSEFDFFEQFTHFLKQTYIKGEEESLHTLLKTYQNCIKQQKNTEGHKPYYNPKNDWTITK